jgi:hypothetical protein
MSIAFLVGGLLCTVGFLGFFLVLARAGAPAKSKQIAALARILQGGAGPRERAMLLGALVIAIIGACLLFTAVARKDAAMRATCDLGCREWGLGEGRIARSRTAEQPLRACFCGEGDAAHQLYELDPSGEQLGASTPPLP